LEIENVTFVGARPKAEMPDFLAATDACIVLLQDIPMFRTNYPNKIFDYLAAGASHILAIDGVIRKVVEEGAGGILVLPAMLLVGRCYPRTCVDPDQVQLWDVKWLGS